MKQGDNRAIHVIWCDDVRQEVGNKLSYMGIYSQQLVPPALPATLPKLCAVVNITTPISQPFQALHVRVIRSDAPDAPILQIDTDPTDVQASLRPPQAATEALGPDGQPATALAFTAVLGMAQLELTAATEWLKVVADVGDGVLESLKLRVTTPDRLAQAG